MDVKVVMASGEVDEWEDAEDTIVDNGALVVVGEHEMDSGEKTITVKQQGAPDMTYRVHAVYAPGMWIKVEYT